MDAAGLSAIAALCSALAALLVLRIQRQVFFESLRPYLVLEGWSRDGGHGNPDAVRFGQVRNIGHGIALNVHLNATKMLSRHPLAMMGSLHVAEIAAKEAAPVGGQINLFWPNVKAPVSGPKFIQLDIQIYCWDLTGRYRHETTYGLMVFERSHEHSVITTATLASRVVQLHRKTVIRSTLRLMVQAKAEATLRRVPLVRRVYRRKDEA